MGLIAMLGGSIGESQRRLLAPGQFSNSRFSAPRSCPCHLVAFPWPLRLIDETSYIKFATSCGASLIAILVYYAVFPVPYTAWRTWTGDFIVVPVCRARLLCDSPGTCCAVFAAAGLGLDNVGDLWIRVRLYSIGSAPVRVPAWRRCRRLAAGSEDPVDAPTHSHHLQRRVGVTRGLGLRNTYPRLLPPTRLQQSCRLQVCGCCPIL